MHRWENYFLSKKDGFHKFWESYLEQEKNILFVVGIGFDPRACLCSQAILEKNGTGKRDFIVVNIVEGKNSPSQDYRYEVEKNKEELERLVKPKGQITYKITQMENTDGYPIGPREAASIFKDASDFNDYTDIVVDISSLPLNIYLPLIGKILFILDNEKPVNDKIIPNLHVTVAENTVIDKSIKKSELYDEASYLYGFSGSLETISTEEEPTIWMPILGEGQDVQIELISNFISPKEICPVLPFPSINPRRGDDLVLEYRELWRERLSIESRNIIYAAEQNPFELYRQLQRAIEHYREALSPLGKCKFAISSLSSKLMSMGVFLVAYEEGISKKQKVGIAYVESKGYSMKKGASSDINVNSCDLFSLWLFGECYNS